MGTGHKQTSSNQEARPTAYTVQGGSRGRQPSQQGCRRDFEKERCAIFLSEPVWLVLPTGRCAAAPSLALNSPFTSHTQPSTPHT